MSRASSPRAAHSSTKDAELWLYGLIDYERRPPRDRNLSRHFHLSRFASLLNELGRPQECFASIQIAGTSGKGWVASALASILQSAGLRTGLYTSPHLATFRERIRIDGRMISEKAFAEGIAELGPRFVAKNERAFRTLFEILTATAFVHFARRRVEIAVVEAGLGGRLDCTTALHPALCVIASIGFDHTAILGHTIREIAREKAGIFKEGVPVVVGPQRPDFRREALAALREMAKSKGTRMVDAERRLPARLVRESLDGSTWEAELGAKTIRLHWSAFGPAAGINLPTILASVEALRKQGFDVPDRAVRDGLKAWRWPGRLEVVSKTPPVILDGAHNPISAATLRAAVDRALPGRPAQWVVGMMRDKDATNFLRELVEGRSDDSVITYTAPTPRAAPATHLACAALDVCHRVASRSDLNEAVALALHDAGPRDPIVVTGTLYAMAPAVEAVRRAFSGTV